MRHCPCLNAVKNLIKHSSREPFILFEAFLNFRIVEERKYNSNFKYSVRDALINQISC